VLRSCFTDVGGGAWSGGLDQYQGCVQSPVEWQSLNRKIILCVMARRQEREHEYAVSVDERQSKRAVWISATYPADSSGFGGTDTYLGTGKVEERVS
jgi:hypothetical protein